MFPNNDLFRKNQKEQTDEYLSQSDDQPQAFSDILNANMQGQIVPSDLVVSDTIQQETIDPNDYSRALDLESEELNLQEPNVTETIEAVSSIPTNSQVSNTTSVKPTKSREEEILERFKQMREEGNTKEKEAKDLDRRNKMYDNILKGVSQMSNAIANQAGYTNINNSPISLLSNEEEKLAGGRKRDLNELMTEYKLINDINKGKSAQDKVYQTRSGLVRLDEKGNPIQVYEDPIMKKMMEQADKRINQGDSRLNLASNREARMIEKFGYDKAQKFEDDAKNALKDIRQKETWKSAEKTLSEVDGMQNLLDDAYTKGGQSLAMIGPKVAKAIAGEVGVLTEADVTRYVKNPELVKGMMDDIKKATSGKLSQASYNNLKRLLDISKKSAQRKMDLSVLEDATVFSRREQIPLEDAMHYLNANYIKNQGTGVEVISPKGKVVVVPIEKLTEALNNGGKLKK